ncbi:ComEC/Rec2 family competence protein [Ideonella alba]|uniref:MBL fold metallo-hydrolase n=1 Tax=Ideonella alba TaxID=2824118 RepID=A0A940YBK0_9BURK|nr:hypothetical protein [Ideonella alba]MBQ0930026.1 hypothetical protein [Ideonella alba]
MKRSMGLEMLPALHGDALLLRWHDGRRPRQLLVDGGPIGAYGALRAAIDALPGQRLELVVLSHVDTDHVDGLLRLFAEPTPWPFSVADVWFNGWTHLIEAGAQERLGGKQGEFFAALIQQRLPPDTWNRAFGGHAVRVPATGALPEVTLPGGLKLTLLSPTDEGLVALHRAWRTDLKGQVVPGDFDSAWAALATQSRYLPEAGLLGGGATTRPAGSTRLDAAPANGSSIAFLAEFGRRSALLLADAHAPVVCASIRRLLATRGQSRLRVDAMKLAHHGSRGNTTAELMALVECPRYLVSTNGDLFGHPDEEALACILASSQPARVQLCFNHLSDTTRAWADPARQQRLGYDALFPAPGTEGLAVHW